MTGPHWPAPMKIISLLSTAAILPLFMAPGPLTAEPLTIKVVVVTMFEAGDDSGDRPGEFQTWVERFPLDEVISMPQGYRDLRYNKKGVLGLVTGIGTARAAASVMALGMDDRFDLSRAYWIVAGISGVDPTDMSLASAAWAEWLVDGDIAHQIDIREAPADWPTGYVPLRKSTPYELPRQKDDEGAVYHLNAGLVEWAYQLSKDVPLLDNKELKILRSQYENFPQGAEPTLCPEGRPPGGIHFLARQSAHPMGQRLGLLLDGWAGKFRHLGHGGHRHPSIPQFPRRGQKSRCAPLPCPALGLELLHAP